MAIPPKAITFDAVGTLFRVRGSVGERYAEAGRSAGMDLDPAALQEAFRTAWKAAPIPEPQRGPRADDDRNWWYALVLHVLEIMDPAIPRGQADAFFDAAYAAFAQPGAWELYPETRGVLENLQGRCRMAVLSNFDRRLHGILEGLGISGFFETVLVSSQIGADKPHPWIFEAAASALGLPAGEILHIGDEQLADEQGPREAGFQAVWLNRREMDLQSALRSAGVTC